MRNLLFIILAAVVSSTIEAGEVAPITTTCVSLDMSGDITPQYINTVHNNSEQRVWVFFEKDVTMSNDKLIYNRLKHRPEGGMSMFEWIVDGNVNWDGFVLDMESFIKIIPPGETFSIVTLHEPVNEKILDMIRVIPDDEMLQYFHALSIIRSTDTPLYQPDVIVVSVSHIE